MGQNHQNKNKGHPWARFGRAEVPERQKANTNTKHSHAGKKTNTPGWAEAPGSPEHQTKNTRHNHHKKDTPGQAEATGHQKRTTNNSDQHQRTKTNRSHRQEEKQNRWGRTSKTKNERHPRASRSPRVPKDKHRPQPPTTTSDKHKPWRMKAEKREMQHKRHRKRGTVTLAPAWERGWGVLVGNKPLVLPPGSTPSHEVSPSQIVQDPGDQYLIIVILSPRIMPNPRALRPQNQQIHFQTKSTLKISMTRSHYPPSGSPAVHLVEALSVPTSLHPLGIHTMNRISSQDIPRVCFPGNTGTAQCF